MCLRRRFAPALLLLPCALAQQIGTPTDALDKLTVDELFSIQVTSVDRKAQELSKAPAAVFVLTGEDIRRSGATCIPEALQWVPGLTVRRVDGRSWVVSARGDARQYADKILVLLDGVSLYTPTFSGVMWDMISVPMQDIERIEVVRGPGAVMWGPNAVNGVINIITKSAASASGGRTSVATGDEVRGATEVGWGGQAGDGLSYRAWGTFGYLTPAYGSPGYGQLMDTFPYTQSRVSNMDSGSGSAGFRIEDGAGSNNQFMVQGSVYKVDRQDPVIYSVLMPGVVDAFQSHSDYLGGYIQGAWTHSSSPGDESTLQFSYTDTSVTLPYISMPWHNLTLDYQKRRQTGARNEIYWGLGYQQYWDSSVSNRMLSFSPASDTYRSVDAVVRDEYQLIPGQLMGSVGIRVDYNSFTRFEYQPSARLLYTPSARQSAWMALSRAVRVPSRVNRDLVFDGGAMLMDGFPVFVPSYGSRSLKSEVERSLEAGYRFQSGQRWSLDASLFWSYYERLMAMVSPAAPEVGFNGSDPYLYLPSTYCNCARGRSYGAEISGAWQVLEGWRILPAYSYLNESRWLPPSVFESYQWDTLPNSVPHQFSLRSQHDLSRRVQFDVMARAYSRDEIWNLPGAFLVDTRLSWRPTRSGELSAGVQNVADRRVVQSYAESPFLSIPLRRTYLIKWTQRF